MTVITTAYCGNGFPKGVKVRFGLLALLISGVGLPQAVRAESSLDFDISQDFGLKGPSIEGQSLPVPELEKVSPSPASWDLSSVKPDRVSLASIVDSPSPGSSEISQKKAQYASLGSRLGAAKWEAGGIFAYMTVTQIAVTKETQSFHFQDEGWFGKNTANLGVDKLTHAFNSYLLAEFFQDRIERKTGNARDAALPAALLASGLMLYSELYDAHKVSSGFSYQDVVFNTAGAAFSALRNSIPGMKDKIDFRLMLIPNSDIYTFKGKRHYEQQRFLLSLELAGFDQFKSSPLRFLEVQVGYRAKGFTAQDIARGETPQRKIFYGVGLNLKELFFKSPRSDVGKVAGRALDYIQIPYTAAHIY